MDDDFHWVLWIPVGVVERLLIQNIDQLRVLLGTFGVEVEFDPRVRAAVGFLQTRAGVEHIVGVLLVLCCDGEVWGEKK